MAALVDAAERLDESALDVLEQLIEARRAVVRHEIAHARAGDPLFRLMLDYLAALHLPATRKRLIRHW
ncbi:MAG: hypothetical protein RQ729_13350, partial [Wenzhouxiangellaceae bacterium]|nr:hypothetical protein [Wenzhouxiangellaceae bacterium]